MNFDNTLKPLIDLDGEVQWQYGVVSVKKKYEYELDSNQAIVFFKFAKNVAESPELRDASTGVGKDISNLSTDLGSRKDVFNTVKAFSETEEAKHLNPEQKRYLRDYLRSGKRGGLELSDAKLEQLKILKKKLSDLGTDYRRCLSEDTSFFWIDEADLDGVPEDVIDSMDVDEDGRRKVTTKYPHYHPVIR